MRLAITGSSGFIGEHVTRYAIQRGHSVVDIDRRHPLRPRELLSITPTDLADVWAVIHCAALADVKDNWAGTNEERIVRDNEIALRHLFWASREARIKTFVFVSTGAVYASQMSPYAASKLAGEAWCKAYADKCGWNLVVVRPAACYGNGYHHGHIADFVRQARETGRVQSLTRGDPRPGLHVEDLAETLVALATDPPRSSEPIFMRARETWGCRDTVRVMGALATWSDADTGWVGDTSEGFPEQWLRGMRPLESGVRDALRSLGWAKV